MHDTAPQLLRQAVEQSRRLIGELESRHSDLQKSNSRTASKDQLNQGKLALDRMIEAARRTSDALARASLIEDDSSNQSTP